MEYLAQALVLLLGWFLCSLLVGLGWARFHIATGATARRPRRCPHRAEATAERRRAA